MTSKKVRVGISFDKRVFQELDTFSEHTDMDRSLIINVILSHVLDSMIEKYWKREAPWV